MLTHQLKANPTTQLPPHLAERLCRLSSHGIREGGEFVVYWMRTAMRAHENPALDAAAEIANKLRVPLVVLQTLEDDSPYASDRLHTFAFESLRDAQRELSERGIAFLLELRQKRGDLSRWDILQRASLVITEEMPVEPHRSTAVELLAYHPACTVDAACVVPMPLTDHAPERAFKFRKATKTLRAERLSVRWEDVEPDQSELPSGLLLQNQDLRDLGTDDIAELVAGREIDHLVAPVRDTPGGSRAGYSRWQAFVDKGLSTYSQKRNDPLEHNGVSRMSAYLHFGCVSPFRLAREAEDVGAKKYLDELLLWREVAWHFCFHSEGIDEYAVLPEWARETLDAHADDPRDGELTWETLARAQTGDPLWDTAQRSLLKHGELHNNVRMTWGKAFINWTATPAEALRLALDLNHRYALDGRDPASYGGILWCFGLFDRPFTPEEPIRGTLRPRETGRHAARLSVDEWSKRVDRPGFSGSRVAVIGGGIAGLTCARALQDHGVEVTLFDKARGPGGRLSTRRGDRGAFDHGAQYFTAFDRRFARHVDSWVTDGVVAQWSGRFASVSPGTKPLVDQTKRQRYVGAPRMSALTRHLATAITDSRYGERVARLKLAGGGWRIFGEDEELLGAYDRLVVALPAPQAAELLGTTRTQTADLRSTIERTLQARMEPCWAVMVEFASHFDPGFDAARVERSALSWVAREASKPGRDAGQRWVLQASPEWSERNLELDKPEVARLLLDELRAVVDTPEVKTNSAHRWRFARVVNNAGADCLFAAESGVVVCGDWCIGPRVGAAWLSGAAAAGRLLGSLPAPA